MAASSARTHVPQTRPSVRGGQNSAFGSIYVKCVLFLANAWPGSEIAGELEKEGPLASMHAKNSYRNPLANGGWRDDALGGEDGEEGESYFSDKKRVQCLWQLAKYCQNFQQRRRRGERASERLGQELLRAQIKSCRLAKKKWKRGGRGGRGGGDGGIFHVTCLPCLKAILQLCCAKQVL